ncbi:MAG: hypothetical protein HQL97_14085 [Magnetococcales bacterium]|nr:hypothetical protein [Magnetococcales bacterium]
MIENLVASLSATIEHPNNSLRRRGVVIAVVVLLGCTGAAWHLHQTRTVNQDQQAVLSSLVAATSARSGLSRQRIWSSLHKRFEVRRASQLKQGDFDAAMAYLASIPAP